jgi:hypothetical protein
MAGIQLSGQIRSDGRNLADRIPSPDSGDINRMSSNSDTGNISMVVGCLNVKVDGALKIDRLLLASSKNDLRF